MKRFTPFLMALNLYAAAPTTTPKTDLQTTLPLVHDIMEELLLPPQKFDLQELRKGNFIYDEITSEAIEQEPEARATLAYITNLREIFHQDFPLSYFKSRKPLSLGKWDYDIVIAANAHLATEFENSFEVLTKILSTSSFGLYYHLEVPSQIMGHTCLDEEHFLRHSNDLDSDMYQDCDGEMHYYHTFPEEELFGRDIICCYGISAGKDLQPASYIMMIPRNNPFRTMTKLPEIVIEKMKIHVVQKQLREAWVPAWIWD